MNVTELKSGLQAHPDLNVLIALPDGARVPAHFHVTEVGHVAKKFVDCGGTFRASEACVLQTYFGSPRDDGHRLTAGKLAHILDLALPILPTGELPVEVEYEDGVISQFPLTSITAETGSLVLQLGLKHTDCLAKERCGGGDSCSDTTGPVDEADACCASADNGRNCC